MALISSSETSGPDWVDTPMSRSRVSVEWLSRCTTGALTRESQRIEGAVWQASCSGLARAIRLGTSSPITSDR